MVLITKVGAVFMLGAVILSGCGSQEVAPIAPEPEESPSKKVSMQLEQENHDEWIAASADRQVRLYAEEEAEHAIEGVILEINGVQKEWDWRIPNTGTDPQVFYTDLTGDGQEEAVIIIQNGRGTGLSTYEIHVVDAKDATEIQVQGYEDIVAEQIESHITQQDDGTLGITMKTQDQEYKLEYPLDAATTVEQEKLFFGGVVIYSLEGQKIKLNIPGSVGVSPIYVCDVNVVYKFDGAKNQFVVDQIEVEPVQLP
ncbi:hypothetical protein D3C74_17380 [compost metagenome]